MKDREAMQCWYDCRDGRVVFGVRCGKGADGNKKALQYDIKGTKHNGAREKENSM